MKVFFLTLGVLLVGIAWVSGAVIIAEWVDATFGGNWKAIPIAVGLAPVVAGAFTYAWEMT